MSSIAKIIVVCGATGSQGGSVLRSLIKSSNYHVRAITRNPNSEAAQKLLKLSNNINLCEANLDNPETLDLALNDAYGVFIVTDLSARTENKHNQQAYNVIDSAVKNKLKHIVLTGLDIDDYALAKKDQINYTALKLCMYYSAITSMMVRTGQNSFAFTAPMENKPLKCQDPNDIGEMVRTVFDNPDEYTSKILHIAGDEIFPDQIVQTLNKHLAPAATFINGNITLERFDTLGLPNQQFLTNMFRNFQKGVRGDIELSRKLNKDLLNFDDYVAKNREEVLQSYHPDKFKSSMQDKIKF